MKGDARGLDYGPFVLEEVDVGLHKVKEDCFGRSTVG